MKEHQEEIKETFKTGLNRTIQMACQSFISKIISVIVIVMVCLSIAIGGIPQFILIIIGTGCILYLAGNYNEEVKKLLEKGINKLELRTFKFKQSF